MNAKATFAMGVASPSITAQCQAQGLRPQGISLVLADRMADAVNLLYVHDALTNTQCNAARKKDSFKLEVDAGSRMTPAQVAQLRAQVLSLASEIADRKRRGAHVPLWLENMLLLRERDLEDVTHHDEEGPDAPTPWYLWAAIGAAVLLVCAAALWTGGAR